MRYLIFPLLLLALASAGAHAQMRCPDGSYRTACPGGGGESVGAPVSSYSAPAPRAPLQFDRNRSDRYRSAGESARRQDAVSGPQSTHDRAAAAGVSRNELVRARNRGQLLVGMTRQDVDYIMGRPDEVNTFVDGNSRCDDLWYRDRSRGWHTRITMCGGQLRSYGADNRQ